MKKFQIYYILLVCFFLSCFTSCTTPTDLKTSFVSGIVELRLENDSISEMQVMAKVALYPCVSINEYVNEIRNEFPFLGKEITQRQVFDHREHKPLFIKQTDENGMFSFENVPYGEYNLVIIKEGWDLIYVYELAVNEKEIILTAIVLKEIIIVTHELTDILENRSYYVPSDVTLVSEHVNISSGFKLYIEPGASFIIPSKCNYIQSSNPFSIITTSDRMFEINGPQELESYYQVHFSSPDYDSLISINDISVSYGVYGIRAFAGCININSSYFVNNHSAVTITTNPVQGVDSAPMISNCTIIGNDLGEGITYLGDMSGSIFNNIVLKHSSGILVKDRVVADVYNNALYNNKCGLTSYHLKGTVRNNEFRNNTECDYQYYFNLGENGTVGSINNNNFHSSCGIDFRTSNDYVWLNVSYTRNNFYNAAVFYKTRIPDYPILDHYMLCLNDRNYFGVFSIENVEKKVIHYVRPEYATILFMPKNISSFPNVRCGPQA